MVFFMVLLPIPTIKPLILNRNNGSFTIEWGRLDLALAGTCGHQDAAGSQNQSLTLISFWQYLALAGICKQLVPLFHGIDHGIATLTISVAQLYHATRVAPVMVLVIKY
jgi:hypothetical protein